MEENIRLTLEYGAFVALFLWIALECTLVGMRWLTRRHYRVARGAITIAFFHPFCAGGGGGERVLWRAIHVLSKLKKEKNLPLHVMIYTGDTGLSPTDILDGVSRQFQISLDTRAMPVSFVYLKGRSLLDPMKYPVLTMLGQSLGSIVVATEALIRATPDVYVDTTGSAFSFLVAYLAGCVIGAYVHYPTISSVSSDACFLSAVGCCSFIRGDLEGMRINVSMRAEG